MTPLNPTLDVVVHIQRVAELEIALIRPRNFPEETSTADCDETGRVEWRASPALCAFFASERGREIIAERPRALELGSGLGAPGLILWRLGARETTLTDGNAGVVDDLRASIAMNRARCERDGTLDSLGTIEAVELSWGGAIAGGVTAALGGRTFPLVIASDVVYSATSARGVLDAVDEALDVSDERSMFVLAYVSRWSHVDRALREAVDETGWRCVARSVQTFDDKAREEALEDRPYVFTMQRGERNDTCEVIWFEDPSTSEARREWLDVPETLKVTPVDALTESFETDLNSALRAKGGAIQTLELNFKGPFKMNDRVLDVVFDALLADASTVKISSVRITECWLDADGWRRVGRFIGLSPSVMDIEVRGEDIDKEGLRAMVSGDAHWVHRMRRVKFNRCERLDGDAASALASAWFPTQDAARKLEVFEISHCPIGDEGVGSLCNIQFAKLSSLHLAHLGVSALGVAELAKTFAQHRSLRELDLSGNDFGASGAAELGDYLSAIGDSLRVLDVRGCNIGDRGVDWMRLESLPHLETLKLGSNGIGDDAMTTLADVLRDAPLAATIIHLDLSMNVITWCGAFDLTDAWSEAARAAETSSDTADAAHIPLESLNLRGNHIGDDGIDAITDVLPALRCLRDLDVSDCDLSESVVEALLRRLRRDPRAPPPTRTSPSSPIGAETSP